MNKVEHGMSSGNDRSLGELENEAADMRRKVSEDVGALGHKLSPSNIKDEAKHMLKDRAHGAVDKTKASVSGVLGSAKDAAHGVAGGGRRFTGNLASAARDNPVPTAMVGLGLGWLAYSAVSQRSKESEPGGDVHDETLAGVRKAERRAHARAQMAGSRISHTYRDNPLLVGAATMGAGVALGMLLPSTEKEDELVGDYRDRLLERAEQQGREVLERGKRAASDAASAAASTAKAEFTESGHPPHTQPGTTA